MHYFSDKQKQMIDEAMNRRKASAERAGVFDRSKNSNKISKEEHDKRIREMLAKDAKLAADLKLKRLGNSLEEWARMVGPRFADAQIEDERIEKIIESKINKIETDGPLHRNSLLLSGKLGVGKTWVAYAYPRKLIARGLLYPANVIHGTETTLLTPLALAGFERPDKIMEMLKPSHKFFLIDEVGRATFRTPEIRHEIWYAIINHVYEHHIPLVLTTNMSTNDSRYGNELENWIGEAAYDRLKNMADVIVPSDENKRPHVNKMMDDGKTLGLEQHRKEDPFALPPEAKKPPSNAPVVPNRANTRNPNTKRSVNDLRPPVR